MSDKCTVCDGDRTVDCASCDGKGYTTGFAAQIEGHDYEKHTCSICNGSGQVECSSCDGTGRR